MLLSACATQEATAPPAAGQVPLPAVVPAPTGDRSIDHFEAQQRQHAEQHTRQGRLAEAALAWEVLTLLRPSRTDYRERLAEARAAIDKAVSQRVAKATAAQQRGDTHGAERAWFEVLAVEPTHGAAAHALREIEKERNRASVVGRFAQPPGLAPRNGAAAAPVVRSRAPERAVATPGQRNLIEHASIMASQGELGAAIAMLSEPAGSAAPDPQAKLLLAQLLMQRADAQPPSQREAAVADLEQALKLNPKLEAARARLQQLQRRTR
ncbi:hypothetical protein [Ideonella sp. A 288]|uniref:hypothetical protein n=1 Tax=Ideonella sp. A 288 TaxID=1962181 RepID=UPI000B4C1100|nr:hypothetical protein [Ideonella sp. A 288]